MQKAIILGSHSFFPSGLKVGIQYMAEGLSQRGWTVDYISTPSSPFDLYGRERRARLKRVWLNRQDTNGLTIRPNLSEYAFRAFFPSHKSVLRWSWQLSSFPLLLPRWLEKRRYNLCIHETSPGVLYLPFIQADLRIFRLSDVPEGFSHHFNHLIIEQFQNNISSLLYDEIWAVSRPLVDYARKINPANTIILIPNGVENQLATASGHLGRYREKLAVYIGGISQWIDLELLEQTANLLPDWQFHLYGPCSRPWSIKAQNIKRFPPISRDRVPELLSRYAVGLIPFRDLSNRMKFVEQPLKFYEYISAGLGVASTNVGALRAGMGEMASFGRTPQEFADAIVHQASEGKKRTPAFNLEFARKHSWESIIDSVCERVLHLQNMQPSPNR